MIIAADPAVRHVHRVGVEETTSVITEETTGGMTAEMTDGMTAETTVMIPGLGDNKMAAVFSPLQYQAMAERRRAQKTRNYRVRRRLRVLR